jgi:hypothetical protein
VRIAQARRNFFRFEFDKTCQPFDDRRFADARFADEHRRIRTLAVREISIICRISCSRPMVGGILSCRASLFIETPK